MQAVMPMNICNVKNAERKGCSGKWRFGTAEQSDDHRILSGELGNRYQTGAAAKK